MSNQPITQEQSSSLLETIAEVFTYSSVSHIAGLLQLNPAAVVGALSISIPVILLTFTTAGSGERGAERLMRLLALGEFTPSSFEAMKRSHENCLALEPQIKQGRTLIESMYGNSLAAIVNAAAGSSQISPGKAHLLLSITAPAVAAAIGAKVLGDNLSLREISLLLSSQRREVLSSLPPELEKIIPLIEAPASAGKLAEEHSLIPAIAGSSRAAAMLILITLIVLMLYLR